MLDPSLLRQKLAETTETLRATRGFVIDAPALEALEAKRKQVQVETENLQKLRNELAKRIGLAKSKGESVDDAMTQAAAIPAQLKANEEVLGQVQAEIATISLRIPNIPHPSVPLGVDETGNIEVRRWGVPKTFDFAVKDHVDLGARERMLDAEAGAKIAGARFTVLKGG